MLQTRNAKRPAQAAVRFAVDAVGEGLLDRARGAGARSTPRRWTRCCTRRSTRTRRSTCSPRASRPRRARPRGRSSSRPDDAVDWAQRGRKVVLVRPFTEADDVHGFFAAQGILTAEGGKASHAALVARGMGKPCVAGASALQDRPRGADAARRRHGAARGRPDRDRRLDRAGHGGRRAAHRRRRSTRTSTPCWAGPTRCGGWACAPTPTRRRTRAARASSAPRASACAGRSTCSWPRTASRRCRR